MMSGMTDGTEGDALSGGPVDSYALLGDAVRRHYLGYYKLVFTDGALDLRTKELIALGVSLATGAPNCVEGHLRKCVDLGVTRAELEEVVATALGVAGASVVDRADIGYAAAKARVEKALAPEGEGQS
jgi:AhpD family alkylhydroperoxidase